MDNNKITYNKYVEAILKGGDILIKLTPQEFAAKFIDLTCTTKSISYSHREGATEDFSEVHTITDLKGRQVDVNEYAKRYIKILENIKKEIQ